MTAKPFLKWAGGKRELLPQLLPHLPRTGRTYFEPFVGGGAVFFALEPADAILGDVNERLCLTYRHVRDDVEFVVKHLQELAAAGAPMTREFYNQVRLRHNCRDSDVYNASRFIFTNRTCFNGLYRENKAGEFNVPWNQSTKPVTLDADNLRACSRALTHVQILHEDFNTAMQIAEPGDVVYCDPPYVPASETASFTAYTKSGFGPEKQRELRDCALETAARGAHVVLSNSDTPEVRALYAGPRFTLHEVTRGGRMNCRGEKRGRVGELIIVTNGSK